MYEEGLVKNHNIKFDFRSVVNVLHWDWMVELNTFKAKSLIFKILMEMLFSLYDPETERWSTWTLPGIVFEISKKQLNKADDY